MKAAPLAAKNAKRVATGIGNIAFSILYILNQFEQVGNQ